MSLKRVVVTGASGFIGRALVAELEAQGVEVERFSGDLFETESLGKRLRSFEPPDAFFRLAWVATPGKYLESEDNVRHVEATLEIVRWAREVKLPKLVMTGSCIEYAFDQPGPVREDARTQARSLYARSKLIVLEVLERSDLPFTWARIFYPYGPGEHPERLFPKLRSTLARGETFRMNSDGSHVRDFVHVEDVARALVACARPDAPRIVNIGSGEGVTLREIALSIAREVGGEVTFGDAALTEPPSIVADVSRLRALGWERLNRR